MSYDQFFYELYYRTNKLYNRLIASASKRSFGFEYHTEIAQHGHSLTNDEKKITIDGPLKKNLNSLYERLTEAGCYRYKTKQLGDKRKILFSNEVRGIIYYYLLTNKWE